ncbi:MAG: hypothetical protein IKA17_07660 [Clostridia bacterium]|nr:hypothetical protein [Clostridia bacterium]
MRKFKTYGGRLFALLFVLYTVFSSITVSAKSNAWEQWQSVITEENASDENLLMSVRNTFAIELWHYSGGYWGNNFVKIYDSQVFDDPDELADAVNAVMDFEMPLPQEIVNVLNDGYNVDVVLSANGIPLYQIFNINKGFTFKYENGNLVFKAYPKFNFSTDYKYNNFVSGLSKQIPFVVAPYGYNRYAMWTRNGSSVGAANGYFNPDNPYDIGSEGIIHPSQIINNIGHLQNGLNIYVDRENGTHEWKSSNNIAVGYKTFANAGAVAVHFDYPVTLSFYKGGKMPDEQEDEPDEPECNHEEPNQPKLPEENTENCGEVIRWTEKDSHTITKPCARHGSHSYTCNHSFVYETSLTTNHLVSPRTLKSGYGFEVEASSMITTRLVSHTGGCSSWGSDRSAEKTPQAPTKAEVRLGYTVTNIIGTQGSTVALERSSNNTTSTTFITAQNPISVLGARTIFTDVALPGTAEAPAVNNFEIYIYGGGVNGVEFCKTIHESITINGSMYDDDGTTS